MTQRDVAKVFGVGVTTINRYMQKYKDTLYRLRDGTVDVDCGNDTTIESDSDVGINFDNIPYLKSLYECREAQGMVCDKVCAYESGQAVNPAYLTRNIKKFLAGCGTENVRLHDLRHTAASMLIRGGMPVVNVSAFLGHNQVSTTTDVYAHVLDNERGKASEAMNSYMESLGFCSESCSESCSETGQSAGDSQVSRA